MYSSIWATLNSASSDTEYKREILSLGFSYFISYQQHANKLTRLKSRHYTMELFAGRLTDTVPHLNSVLQMKCICTQNAKLHIGIAAII
jgi:hypothetical protein